MYDLIIVGAGPAGLSAAIYGVRGGLDTLVIESNPIAGGQILNTYEVDNYLGLPKISGFDLGTKFREHADELGVNFKEGQVYSIAKDGGFFKVDVDGEILESKTVIVATGAEHSHLGVPGEEELSGMGVSYCATCDGAFFKGRTVAVVGGGDVALEDAIFLSRNCAKVYLIHRRDEFRGAFALQKELKSLPNVEFILNSTVIEINGEDMVESVKIKNVLNNEVMNLPLDGVFIAVGIKPNTNMLSGVVNMDAAGYVIAAEDCQTSVPGLFAAGDIRKKPLRQIITAVADGANAAICASTICGK